MSFRVPVVYGFVALLIAPPCLAAQTTAGPDVWRDFAATIEPGTRVSVRLVNGQRFKATLLRAAPDAVTLMPRTRVPVPMQRIPFDVIRSLELDEGGLSTAKAVGIGVASGAGAFLAIILVLAASFGE